MRRALPVLVIVLLIAALIAARLIPTATDDAPAVEGHAVARDGEETATPREPRKRQRSEPATDVSEAGTPEQPPTETPVETSAVEWLLARQQPDGSWAPGAGDDATRTELTAVVTLVLLANPLADEESRTALERALAWLRAQIGEDGRIVDPEVGPHRRSHAVATLALIEAAGLSGRLEEKQQTSMPLTLLLADLGGPGFNREGSDRDSEAELATWSAVAIRSGSLVMGEDVFQESFGRLLERSRSNMHGFFGDASDVAFGDRSVAMLTCAEILLGADPSKEERVRRGVAALLDRTKDGGLESDPRLAYFGTMVTFLAGGEAWKTWRGRLAETPRPAKGADGKTYDVAARALADTIVNRYARVFGNPK